MATAKAFGMGSPLLENSSTALVTGSTDGIGLTTAKNLASKGYNVIIHGRNRQRIIQAIDAICSVDQSLGEKIFGVESDISSLQGCKNLVYKVKSIIKSNNLSLDILMNNAGVFERGHILTEDDLETTFAVNVMAPFVITSNLLPELLQKKDRQSRVVFASSMSQCRCIDDWEDLQFRERPFSAHRAYAESKVFDAMLAAEFASILEGNGFGANRITCNSLDPGTVNTKMLLAGWGPIGTEVDSALDEVWLCSSPEVSDISGAYFSWRNKSSNVYKPSEREKLWKVLSGIDPSSTSEWENVKELL